MQRYGIAPATDAEKAAAMQYVTDNDVNGSVHQGGAAAEVEGSEVCNQGQPASQPTQPVQNSSPCADETSYGIVCCGFVIRRQSTA